MSDEITEALKALSKSVQAMQTTVMAKLAANDAAITGLAQTLRVAFDGLLNKHNELAKRVAELEDQE